MLKKLAYTIFSIMFMFLWGCKYGQIKVTEDAFKNRTVVTVKMKYKSEEKKYFSGDTLEVTYVKELDRTTMKPDKFTLNLSARGSLTKSGDTLDEKGFLQIDNQNYDLIFNGTSTSTSVHTTTQPNNSTSYGGSNQGQSTTTSVVHRVVGKVDVDPTTLEKMITAQSLVIRLYVSGEPRTFASDAESVQKMREFAQTSTPQ